MARQDERLIRENPENDDAEGAAAPPLVDKKLLWTVIKVSLSLGVIASLLTGLILVRARLVTTETQIADLQAQVEILQKRQEQVVSGVTNLNKLHADLKREVDTLDINAAKGDLSEALNILHIQSDNFDQQLAVTRNGMMSLSRMVKGSRVWQEDYKSQYESLFTANTKLKEAIKALRGIQEKKEEAPKYIEIDF